MAARLETSTKRFIGRESDDKPTSEVPVGSTFFEEDTGSIWRWNGNAWTKPPQDNNVTSLLAQIASDIKVVREKFEAFVE